jgi:large subunit ribosomal protein L21
MAKCAVIQTGGKQYLVKKDQEIYVDRLDAKENDTIELDSLATFDEEKGDIDLHTKEPGKVQATVVAHMKGDKVRVAKFKAKVRYRKVRGFRPYLTQLKIARI